MFIGNIVVTGGTGTFGKAFVRYLLDHCGWETTHQNEHHAIHKIIVLSRDEYKQHEMKLALSSHPKADKLRFFIGDVRDLERLELAFDDADVVVHAAAMKHVTLCETNPSECVKTNVLGTMNVIHAAINAKVKRVVFLSTDKAVEPINLYGASKMMAERHMLHANVYSHLTRFSCLRYGNVLGSRGSVIEHFLNSDHFAVTDPRMTRFFMRPEEACRLCIFAIMAMRGGEVFIPVMKAASVMDIVNAFDDGREMNVIGSRPGEKLDEILVNQEEIFRVCFPPTDFLPDWSSKYRVIYPPGIVGKAVGSHEAVKMFSSATAPSYTKEELKSLIDEARNV